MALTTGSRLGPYEILAPLGAGGMGEVYRARDTRLERTVAIKVLSAELSRDSTRRERFRREAKAISSLNHPHICTLHDIGTDGGADFLVMEYLEGETLAERLKKGALLTEQLLRVGVEIADALNKAHRLGIVHRDLKPANIMLTKSGVKLLDFGLAKFSALVAAMSLSPLAGRDLGATAMPTASQGLTAEGTIIGTLHYMAPEQLEGKEADARSDIFALGAVLYEMATGRKAFEGKSSASVIAAIVTAEPPPVRSLQPLAPPALERLIQRCLAKDPEERWQSAHDLKLELGWLAEKGAEPEVPAARAGVGVQPSRAMRLAVPLSPRAPLVIGERHALALSPDGMRLVYAGLSGGRKRLYLRMMGETQLKPLDGTEDGSGPFFSPDGQWIGFFAGGKLKRVAAGGGTPVVICDARESRGATWCTDDTIIFAPSQSGGLWQVRAAGGSAAALTVPDVDAREVTHRWPHFIPSSNAVLFTVGRTGTASYDEAAIGVKFLDSGEQQIVIEQGTDARFVPPGQLIFARGGSLLAVPFNPRSCIVCGSPASVLEGVITETTGSAQWSSSEVGSLVYVPGGARGTARHLVWVSRRGAVQVLPGPPHAFEEPRLSPDGGRIAVGVRTSTSDIWIYDLKRNTLTRLTYEGFNFAPIWTPDAKRLTFSSSREGPSNVFWMPADGGGPVETLLESEFDHVPGSWSPDGRLLAVTEYHPEGAEILVVPMREKRQAVRVPPPGFNKWSPAISRDGKWLAYTSNESGAPEVYLRPFPSLGEKIQVSNNGGSEPVWAKSGKELFYRNTESVMAVALRAGAKLRFSKPRRLFENAFVGSSAVYHSNYDISSDGRLFLMLKEAEEQTAFRQVELMLGR
jgi:eukaryotic-like serine/threonine-protein kinase